MKKPYKKKGKENLPKYVPRGYRNEVDALREQSYTNGVFDTLATAHKYLSGADFVKLVVKMVPSFDRFIVGDLGHLKDMAALDDRVTISGLLVEALET